MEKRYEGRTDREKVGAFARTLAVAVFGVGSKGWTPCSGVVASDGVFDFDDLGAGLMKVIRTVVGCGMLACPEKLLTQGHRASVCSTADQWSVVWYVELMLELYVHQPILLSDQELVRLPREASKGLASSSARVLSAIFDPRYLH